MILEDESILSAYLDGRLGPEERHAVESALLEDPRLADDLRGLAAVRDLLAGLPRESPRDLSGRVLRQFRRRALLGVARGALARGPVRAATLVTIAAGLMVSIMMPWMLPRLDRGVAPETKGSEMADIAPHKTPPGPSDPRWPAFSHPRTERGHADQPRDNRPTPAPVKSADAGREELAHVREYLEHPGLRQVFLVTDPGDGSDERRVASIVEETTRYNFYKITVAQGIAMDPKHPERATVFALVVGPRELESLRDQLRVALHERVEERPADHAVMTRLAQGGQVEACSPVAELQIPREDLAFRQDDPTAPAQPPPDIPRSGPTPALTRTNGPTPEQERSSPAAEVIDRSIVVLVWVARARPG